MKKVKNSINNYYNKMKKPFALLLILSINLIYSQSFDKSVFFKKADNLILKRTNLDFFSKLVRDTICSEDKYVSIEKITDNNRFESDLKYRDSLGELEYTVAYKFKLFSHNAFNNDTADSYFYINNGHSTYLLTDILLSVDKEYNFKHIPDFNSIMSGLNMLELKRINVEQAKKTATKYFGSKTRNTDYSPMLVFNSNKKTLNWIIIRRKGGFKKYTDVWVYIDAIENKYVKKEKTEMSRSFWQAIGDFFSGDY